MQFFATRNTGEAFVLSSADKEVYLQSRLFITAAVENILVQDTPGAVKAHIDDPKVQDVFAGATRQLLRAVNSREYCCFAVPLHPAVGGGIWLHAAFSLHTSDAQR